MNKFFNGYGGKGSLSGKVNSNNEINILSVQVIYIDKKTSTG